MSSVPSLLTGALKREPLDSVICPPPVCTEPSKAEELVSRISPVPEQCRSVRIREPELAATVPVPVRTVPAKRLDPESVSCRSEVSTSASIELPEEARSTAECLPTRGFADDLRRCRGAKRLEPLRSGYDGRDRTVADRLGVDRDAQVAVPSFDRHVVDHVVVGRDENVRCGRIDRDPDSPRDVQGVVVARPAALLCFHPAAAFQRPGPPPAVTGFRRGVSCGGVSCRDVSCRRMFRRGGSVFRSGGFRRGAEGRFRLRGGPGEEAEQGEQSFFHIGCILGVRSVRRRPEGRRIPLRGYAAVASAGPGSGPADDFKDTEFKSEPEIFPGKFRRRFLIFSYLH